LSKIFEPFQINRLKIKNRFVRSATVDNLGKDMQVTQSQIDFYRELTLGEVGLIISSGLFPSLDGWAAPGQLGIHDDRMIPSLRKLVDVVHRNEGRVAAQLMHAGGFGNPGLSGFQVVGPSAMVYSANDLSIRELSSDEVYRHVEDFVQAARRAIESGFDAVQIHGAHGWLVSSFFSPVTNSRTDMWGGSAQKRANFAIEIVKGIRKLAGPDYPLLIKLGLKDYHPRGKSLAEGIESALLLIEAGIDAVEISEGVEEKPFHHIRLDALKPYYLDECMQAREKINKPLILVGGMRKLADIQMVVDGGIADAVSMCRPFIMDQYLVARFMQKTADSSKCRSCNTCVENMHKQNIHCVFKETLIENEA